MINRKILITLTLSLFLALTCKLSAQVLPLSDPNNTEFWNLLPEVSDEFNENSVDEDKWYIVGKFEDGKPVYKDPDKPNRKVWIGRAPSQFSGRNYRLEDGNLVLEARWEPDFPFSDTFDEYGDTKYYFENITTPCFIGRKLFTYGYMEIRCKAADAEITSSFWATGNNAELDMFEFFGDHRQPNKAWRDKELWWSIHDWRPGMGGKSVYTEHHELDFRVADDFHTYGFDWSPEGIKYYIDGELFRDVSKDEINAYAVDKGFEKGWMIDKSLKIWLDMETFPWHGVPDSKSDLTLNGTTAEKDNGRMDYTVDYVRVWQRGSSNLIDDDFFSFESTLNINGKEESWWVPASARENISISSDKASAGTKALKFEQSGTLSGVATAFAPKQSTNIEAGEYKFSCNIWLEANSAIKTLRIVHEDPWVNLDFDMSSIETGKWVTLSKNFIREATSGPNDRIRVQVRPEFTDDGATTLYIDELKLEKVVSNSLHSINNANVNIYPNPTSDFITIEAENAELLQIVGLTGRIEKTVNLMGRITTIDVNDLSNGLYFTSVIKDGLTIYTKKILVQ